MIGLLIIFVAVTTALAAAASLRLSSLVSSLLAAYLAFVANVVAVVVALSSLRGVTRCGLLVAELALFGVVAAVWWARGRPGLPLGGVGPAVRAVLVARTGACFA